MEVEPVLPSFSKLIINNGIYTFHETIIEHINMRDYFDASDYFAEKKHSILDYIMKAFELLDSVLDEENHEAVGKDLTKKYELLKKDADYDIVFSQIYRILSVIRNARVHDSKSIIISNDNVTVSRNDRKGSKINLVAKKDLIKFILSYAIYYTNVRTIKINECYKLNLAIWYYSKIMSSISEYTVDGNNIDLIKTKNDTIFFWISSRYICENISYEITDDKINFIIKKDFLFSPNKRNNSLDFVFTIDNKSYMVPYEIVHDGNISLSDIQHFEFSGDIPEYLDKFYSGLSHKI